jgi:hypothetical protein
LLIIGFSRTQFYLGHQHTLVLVASITQDDSMKFFVLTAVLAACAVSSLVSSLGLSLQWHNLMAKCSRRVALSIPWNQRQPPHVAPAPATTIVSITHLVHLIAVMASGMYSGIGNRFQITYVVNPLHNDSNIFGCACRGGCRNIQSETRSLESYKSFLCV